MGKDKRGIVRGKCTLCPCEEFDTEGSILCEYCGHPPINHVVLDHHGQASKKMKKGNPEHAAEEEDSCEYNVTGQHNDSTVPQSIDIDPVSTSSMPNNSDSEKQDHNEIIEIDAIPSSSSDSVHSDNQEHSKLLEPKTSNDEQPGLPKSDNELKKLQKIVDETVRKQLHQSTSVQLSVCRKNSSVSAHCNVCNTEIVLRSIGKAPYCVRQHLATQIHKTNTLIAHSRESNVSLELSALHAQINTKYPNVFIVKKSSAFCRACKTDMSLLGRNIMGNLAQHVKSSGHVQNAGKGDATSARDIASFFAPIAKKSSKSADTKD